MKYQVYNSEGSEVKKVDLNPAIFSVSPRIGLIHQAAVAQASSARTVLAHAKDKSEVRGGGKKPWKQKGTGRARHGSSRSPIWIGGGATFGPTKDRNFGKKINKKMKRKALFMCLTDRASDEYMVLLDKFEIKDNKTKEFVALVKSLKKVLKLERKAKKAVKNDAKKKSELTETKKSSQQDNKKSTKFDLKNYKTSILIVVGKGAAKVSRIVKNIPGVKVIGANSLNVVDILTYKNLLVTEDALEVIEKTYIK
jgi:large subunit ribosomal protein L4